MIGGERRLLLEILGQTDRVGAKSPIFDLFTRASAVIPSKKKFNYWDSTSGLDSRPPIVIGMSFCIGVSDFIKIPRRTAEL